LIFLPSKTLSDEIKLYEVCIKEINKNTKQLAPEFKKEEIWRRKLHR
jgi:hypothetical protein